MKVYVNTKFTGLWPVGTAAVVAADSAEEAAALLEEELKQRYLRQVVSAADMQELDLSTPRAWVLRDGNH